MGNAQALPCFPQQAEYMEAQGASDMQVIFLTVAFDSAWHILTLLLTTMHSFPELFANVVA